MNTYNQTISPFFFEGSNNVVGASFILTNLASDLSTVRLLRTSANYIPQPEGNEAVIANVNDINNTIGFWRPQPDFRIAQRISPGLEEFPDLELEAAYQDLVETFVDYQTDVLLRGIEQTPNADLVLGYIEQPDGSGHQFLLTDPRQPTDPSNPNSIGAGQDPAKVERYADYRLNAYQAASEAVQRVIDTVGVDSNGVPNSNIIITSDHGFAPFHTAVDMNNILENAGFDPNEVRAVTSGPAVNIYINVEGREPDGTVDPSEYKELQQQVLETLESLQDTNSIYAPEGAVPLFDEVYERSVPNNPTVEDIITASSEFIGQDTGDVFALLSLGYNFDGFQETLQRLGDQPAAEQPIFSVPTFYGAHGYDPTLPEMQAIFIAAGPDFTVEQLPSVEGLRTIDIAPTLLDLLDVEPASTVEGQSIFEATFSGTVGADRFAATEADDLLLSSAGDDTIAGGLGSDTIFGENGSDVLRGDLNRRSAQVGIGDNDTIFGGAGDDRIGGKGGNDGLFGDDGDDQIWGDDGDDLLRGGLGSDTLTGDAFSGSQGEDTFVLAAGEGTDTITDFEDGIDFIGLAEELSFGQLTVTPDGNNTLIRFENESLAILRGVQASDLTVMDFTLV